MKIRNLIFLGGMIIILLSVLFYLKDNFLWYYFLPFGAWILFDYISYKRNNKTTLDLIIKKDYRIIKLFILLMIAGYIIELFGSVISGFWTYKIFNYEPILFSLNPSYIVMIINYSFILASFRESYRFFESFFKNKFLTTIITMFIGILIWEIPNIFSKNWIYKIPFISLEIFYINIIVIVGWVILIWTPILIYKYLKIK